MWRRVNARRGNQPRARLLGAAALAEVRLKFERSFDQVHRLLRARAPQIFEPFPLQRQKRAGPPAATPRRCAGRGQRGARRGGAISSRASAGLSPARAWSARAASSAAANSPCPRPRPAPASAPPPARARRGRGREGVAPKGSGSKGQWLQGLAWQSSSRTCWNRARSSATPTAPPAAAVAACAPAARLRHSQQEFQKRSRRARDWPPARGRAGARARGRGLWRAR